MKIAFYGNHTYWGQLNNNGGTRSILLSINALKKLGHEAVFVAHKDRFTWFEHDKPVHKIPRDADAVVAISISEVDAVLKHGPKHTKKFLWMRGWETWQMPEKKILKAAKKIAVICNSTWQKDKLMKHGIKAKLCYSGLDLNDWCYAERKVFGKKRIGCLFHKKLKTKRWKDFHELSIILGHKDFEYVSFGVGRPDNVGGWLTEHLKNPEHEELKRLYQSCHMWFAPTRSEGFHNVCAEAALCGCLCIVNDCNSNGMGDYADISTAHIYGTVQEAAVCIRNPDYGMVEKMADVLENKIGDRKKNMRKFVGILRRL